MNDNTLYALIVASEVAFWIVLLSGLGLRYVLQWPRTSKIVLWCVPLIDVALLAFTALDLRAGTHATLAHGLATAYVGFTVVFGSLLMRWADQRFAVVFDGATSIDRPRGWAAVIQEFKLWARCVLAVVLTYGLLTALIAFIDDPDRTRALLIWYRILFGTIFCWFVFGPVWSLVFFERESALPLRATADDLSHRPRDPL